MSSRIVTFVRAFALVTMLAATFILPAAPAQAADPRYFPETGYRIADDQIWDYFQKRGGINQFGYPVSRKFQFMGSQVQFFQRRIVQIQGGGVGQINLLDPGIMPYTNINGASFPANNEALVKTAPAVGSANYAQAIQDWIKANAPESFNGKSVKYYSTYTNAVTFKTAFPDGKGEPALLPGMNLEMWGAPTSAPAADPKNNNFIYLRFQRGIMHYDAATGTTQGLLLADYFKSIITGQNLPGDLDSQAKGSPFYKQYDNSKANGIARQDQMPNSNMKDAFEKDSPVDTPSALPTGSPTRTTGLRYGMQGHLFFGDRDRAFGKIREAGFGWAKQQVRWADFEPSRGNIQWGLLDGVVASSDAAGTKMMFSVVTAPTWSRSDGKVDGPPNNSNDLANFLAAVATRYKGRVHAYEVWNEQNFSREWGGGTINAGAYVEMLKVVYPRIKAADPNAIVVSGALTPTGVNDLNVAVDDKVYLQQMYAYQNGVFKSVADAVGAHMAGYNNAPEDWSDKNTVNTPGFKGHPSFYFRRIDDLYSVMSANGDNRQMWLTEYHWASASAPVPAGYEWTTHLSEQQVADFFVRSIQSIRASRPWVGAVFVWNLNWRTFADPHTSETAIFGILNPDWTGRLIYNRLKDMPK